MIRRYGLAYKIFRFTKSAEKPRHSCRGGIGVGRAGLNAQEPNKTHAVPEPSMGEGTAEREAPAFMPGRTSPKKPAHTIGIGQVACRVLAPEVRRHLHF